MSDKRQSINNYVYNRRKNRDSEPIKNENDFNFSNGNNTENQNTSSSMYNSYVSENDYNSYTSGYQPTSYSSYSQPQQNDYNNNFNSYNQPQQNGYNNNFNNYNQPVQNQNTPVGHNAVEIPLSRKMPLSTIILLSAFGSVFILMIVIGILSALLNWTGNGLMIVMMIIFFGGFFTIAFSMIFGSAIDRHQAKKVCKTQVKGRFVGFMSERRKVKHGYRTYYAPKYEIFINNRYEIRTVNVFNSIKSNWGNEINLLVDPKGYEAIPATKADFPKRSAGEWISALVVGIIILVFFLGPLILSLIH